MVGSRTYSISKSSATVPNHMEEGETTVCSCERLIDVNITNGSLSRTSTATTSSVSLPPSMRRGMMSGMLITLIVIISQLTCCVSAWPMLNQRRTFSYAPVAAAPPSSVVIPDYSDLAADQWAMAAQPRGLFGDSYYDLPVQQPQDIYDDQLYEDTDDAYPYFGPILDAEPEEEVELEGLKHEQPFVYERRRLSEVTKKPLVASALHATTSTPTGTTETSPTIKSSTVATTSSKKVNSRESSPAVAASPVVLNFGGQKEIPMLRPPSPKSHHIQADEPEEEPKISVAQRSPSNEKPSAYDRLRKYLSLDDALKKEYQQRRAAAVSRHTKRSSIITDSDSLTGQLNSLKKKMD